MQILKIFSCDSINLNYQICLLNNPFSSFLIRLLAARNLANNTCKIL